MMALLRGTLNGGWTMNSNEQGKGKLSSLLLDKTQAPKIYTTNLENEHQRNKGYNKASTLTTDANNTQTEMNIDMLGFDDSFAKA